MVHNDLISRSALLDEMYKGTIIPDDMYSEGIMAGVDYAIKKIEAAPAADAVEVVRCKDCVYWGEAKPNKKGFLICPASGMEIMETDFCSYRERRADECI